MCYWISSNDLKKSIFYSEEMFDKRWKIKLPFKIDDWDSFIFI